MELVNISDCWIGRLRLLSISVKLKAFGLNDICHLFNNITPLFPTNLFTFKETSFFVTTSVSPFCVGQKEIQVRFHAFKGIITIMGNILKD